MNDWISISFEISYKNYDGCIHIRKLNLNTGKYTYLNLYDHEFLDIFGDDSSLCQQWTVIVTERDKHE